MNYLLDTHTFVWLDGQSSNLSSQARQIIADPQNGLFVSLTSLWEIQIKSLLGKFVLRAPLQQIVSDQADKNNIALLPITLTHIVELTNLPNHHRDPFDRLLIAQAKVEGYKLLSRDPIIAQYPIPVIW